jgi:hypothetical protein
MRVVLVIKARLLVILAAHWNDSKSVPSPVRAQTEWQLGRRLSLAGPLLNAEFLKILAVLAD